MQGLMAPSRRLQLPGGDFLFDPVRKMGDHSGLPRQGLVALYDPYRDAYGLDATARAALQTGTDYSGRGNTLTYGANTNASTDDPSNTGTAWSFDGGDFATIVGTARPQGTALTLNCVLKIPNGVTGWQWAVACGDDSNFSAGFGIALSDGTQVNIGASGMVFRFPFSSIGFTLGQTVLLTLTAGLGSKLRVYTNGVLKYTSDSGYSTFSLGATSGAIGVGKAMYYSSPYLINGSEINLLAIHGVEHGAGLVYKDYLYIKSLMASRGVTLA